MARITSARRAGVNSRSAAWPPPSSSHRRAASPSAACCSTSLARDSRVLLFRQRASGVPQMLPDLRLADVVDRGVGGRPRIPGYDGGLCVQLRQKTGGVGVHRPVVHPHPVLLWPALAVASPVRRGLAGGCPDNQDHAAVLLLAGDAGDVARLDAAALSRDPPIGLVQLFGSESPSAAARCGRPSPRRLGRRIRHRGVSGRSRTRRSSSAPGGR